MLLTCALAFFCPQETPGATATSGEPIRITLTAKAPEDRSGLRWSPKGATVPLAARGDALAGEFPLGPATARPVRVELTRSEGSERFDRLAIDADRDGAFGDAERLTTTPKETRGKWWSSFETVLLVPHANVTNAYPVSLWFVFDPQEPDAAPVLRWSRRGWHEGSFEFAGKTVHVLITENAMDGVFTGADSWQLGSDRTEMLRASGSSLTSHAWLGEQAMRVTSFEPDGTAISIAAFDPGFTRAEERERNDTMRADREAKRAASPLAFGHDYAAALGEAKRTGKKLFVDFETTWCGPCKAMDQMVYTAQDVVDAAKDAICVKVDGDEHRDLVKKHAVSGYPTMLLLDGDGKELERAVGYQSVKKMVAFFAK